MNYEADRFQRLTIRISHMNKTIQRIKTQHMNSIGMKGSHAICISCLFNHPEGMTAANLCVEADLDKAAVSRILRELEAEAYIRYGHTAKTEESKRQYKSLIFLTEEGQKVALEVGRRIYASVQAGRDEISDAELDKFYEILDRLTENLDSFSDALENCSDIHDSSDALDSEKTPGKDEYEPA